MKAQSSISSIVPYLIMAFLNTFVDIGHKALMMDTVYSTSTAHTFTLLSSTVNGLMLLPYILFFTPCGFIADRWPKALVLRWTVLSAIPITLFLTLCYYKGWFWLAFCGTVLMALQSAINSPAKYGYIKETFGKSQIARANGMVQAVVIFAIVISQAVFTFSANALVAHRLPHVSSKDVFITGFAPIGFVLVVLAICEYYVTRRLIQSPAADQESKYEVGQVFKLRYLRDYLSQAFSNKTIVVCILGLSLFFAVNQELLAIYGAYLKETVGSSANFALSSVGVAGVGILIGAGYAGRISRGFIEVGVVPISSMVLCAGLLLLGHLHSEAMIVLVLVFYGIFAGMLIVPLNALIQFHAPRASLGKIVASNNFMQMVAMLLYLIVGIAFTSIGIAIITQLHLMVVLAFVGAVCGIFYLPQSLLRLGIFLESRRRFSLQVLGLDNLPSQGGALLLGYQGSDFNWATLQVACPRSIRFVFPCDNNHSWYWRFYFKRTQQRPIVADDMARASVLIRQALQRGEVVCCLLDKEVDNKELWQAMISPMIHAAMEHDVSVIPVNNSDCQKDALSNFVTVAYGAAISAPLAMSELQSFISELKE